MVVILSAILLFNEINDVYGRHAGEYIAILLEQTLSEETYHAAANDWCHRHLYFI
jgi:hypothetical protein